MPNPTTQASKLMQMRRNVSDRMRWISHAPIGTPMSDARQNLRDQRDAGP